MRIFLMKIVLERKHHLLKSGMFHKNTVVWTRLLLQFFSSSRRNFWVGFKIAVIWNDHMKYGKTRLHLCSKAKPASFASQVSICWARGFATFIFWEKCLMVSASFQHGIKPNTEGSIFLTKSNTFFQPVLAAALMWSLVARVLCPAVDWTPTQTTSAREFSGTKASVWH